jgi:hypothetical protein
MKKRFSGPQIVAKLRQADVLIGQGKAIPEVFEELEVSQLIIAGVTSMAV